jgi:putative ABC transport system ATP-binding protein
MPATVDSSTGTLAAQAVAVTKVYGHGPGAVTALDGVTVGFRAGTFTAVMDPQARASPPCCTCSAAWTRPHGARSTSKAATCPGPGAGR